MSDKLLSEVLDKERYSETPGLRMGMELTLTCKKWNVSKPQQWKAMTQNSVKRHGKRC
jgi:hypothetical protein